MTHGQCIYVVLELIPLNHYQGYKVKSWQTLHCSQLDMAKVYDRLNYNFLSYTLSQFQFPPSFIHLIMDYVTTISISIRYNGCTTQPFKPTMELRQGDAISSLLFNLCLSFLSALIQSTCNQGEWMVHI